MNIAIEVATTLERKHANFFTRGKAAPTGITGDVILYVEDGYYEKSGF